MVAGIGLLRLDNWGRKLSIGYAIYADCLQHSRLGNEFHFRAWPASPRSFKEAGTRSCWRVWRGCRREHRRMLWPDLSGSSPRFHDAPESCSGVSSSIASASAFDLIAPRKENLTGDLK